MLIMQKEDAGWPTTKEKGGTGPISLPRFPFNQPRERKSRVKKRNSSRKKEWTVRET